MTDSTDSFDPTTSTPSEEAEPSAANAAWVYLTLTVAFTLYGLSRDVVSGVASALLLVGFFAVLFVPYLVYRARTGRWREPASRAQRFDAVAVLVLGAAIAATLIVGFVVPRVLIELGVPLPYTLCWFAIGVLLFATAKPLNRWSARRRNLGGGATAP